jgi:cytochrome c-type biogenesis protein CcmE
VEGSLAKNGSFVAEQVQAKCASKYEAAPTADPPAKSADKGSGSAQPGSTM